MCYFEQQVPCQAGLGGVAGKGRSAAHGLGVPQGARGTPRGSKQGRGKLGLGAGSRGSALASYPSLAAAPPQPDLSAAVRTLFTPETRASLLPSNDAPCCIATRIRVPSLFPPPGAVGPLPTRVRQASRPRLAPTCSGCRLPDPRSAPEPRSPLALTRLRPPLAFTCDFAKTRHQTRASTPGRWFIVCARARRDEPEDRPVPLPAQTLCRGRMRPTLLIMFAAPPPPPKHSHRKRVGSEIRAGNGSFWQERGKK